MWWEEVLQVNPPPDIYLFFLQVIISQWRASATTPNFKHMILTYRLIMEKKFFKSCELFHMVKWEDENCLFQNQAYLQENAVTIWKQYQQRLMHRHDIIIRIWLGKLIRKIPDPYFFNKKPSKVAVSFHILNLYQFPQLWRGKITQDTSDQECISRSHSC